MTDDKISRTLSSRIQQRWFSGKAILLLGARQVGKTTLLKNLVPRLATSAVWLNGDNPQDRALLSGINSDRAKRLFPEGTVVVVDEAQR